MNTFNEQTWTLETSKITKKSFLTTVFNYFFSFILDEFTLTDHRWQYHIYIYIEVISWVDLYIIFVHEWGCDIYHECVERTSEWQISYPSDWIQIMWFIIFIYIILHQCSSNPSEVAAINGYFGHTNKPQGLTSIPVWSIIFRLATFSCWTLFITVLTWSYFGGDNSWAHRFLIFLHLVTQLITPKFDAFSCHSRSSPNLLHFACLLVCTSIAAASSDVT